MCPTRLFQLKVRMVGLPRSNHTERFNRVGIVARWQPVHLGHVPVLEALCACSRQALIGIGSSNRYNLRNPFTVDERMEMLQLVLSEWDHYALIAVPDLDDGPRWRDQVKDLFGSLDLFVTDNPYVASLLAEDYKVIKPVELIPEHKRIAIDGSLVRLSMAKGEDWQDLVPNEIEDLITLRLWDERFRREFGLQTLALETIKK
jgi:nicotinamide-nucleotide adenylyltransferase